MSGSKRWDFAKLTMTAIGVVMGLMAGEWVLFDQMIKEPLEAKLHEASQQVHQQGTRIEQQDSAVTRLKEKLNVEASRCRDTGDQIHEWLWNYADYPASSFVEWRATAGNAPEQDYLNFQLKSLGIWMDSDFKEMTHLLETAKNRSNAQNAQLTAQLNASNSKIMDLEREKELERLAKENCIRELEERTSKTNEGMPDQKPNHRPKGGKGRRVAQ